MNAQYIKTKGRDLIISTSYNGMDYTPVALAKSCVLDVTVETKEVASRSGRAKEFKAGRYSWNLSSDRVYDAMTDDSDVNQVRSMMLNLMEGDEVYVRFAATDASKGDVTYSGIALITHVNINAPTDGYSSASVQMMGTGALSATI